MSNSNDALLFWEKFKRQPELLATLSKDFDNLKAADRISLMSTSLHGPDRILGIMLLPYLNTEEKKDIFSDLIYLASFTHGGLSATRKAIMSLPKKWLLENIEMRIEPYLQNSDYEQYRRFLELVFLIDENIAKQLACRASQNSDYDIKEAGEDFLSKLSS